ncbi:MAG: crossover junction endodeoxyribonuclease RuvC [Microgenomates group bacterium]
MTRVLGIDPGTHRLGWGVVDGTPSRCHLVACDCLEFPKNTSSPDYLLKIQSHIENLILKYHPDKVGIEALFVQKNLKTAMTVAEARGVILYTFAKLGLTWTEMSPNTIKSIVAGAGNAGKLEVERMVGLLLHIDTKKLLDDTTDALAIALAVQATKL